MPVYVLMFAHVEVESQTVKRREALRVGQHRPSDARSELARHALRTFQELRFETDTHCSMLSTNVHHTVRQQHTLPQTAMVKSQNRGDVNQTCVKPDGTRSQKDFVAKNDQNRLFLVSDVTKTIPTWVFGTRTLTTPAKILDAIRGVPERRG